MQGDDLIQPGRWTLDDLVLRRVFVSLTNSAVTAFIETGTYLGYTSAWIAKRCTIPMFTCEINSESINHAKRILPKRVNLYEMSSEQFIPRIANDIGTLPFFFLDAHWYKYWPLLDELRIISELFSTAIILVHDLQIPKRPRVPFERPRHGYPRLTLQFIEPALMGHKYRICFPKYSPCPRGYGVIFQDLDPFGLPGDEFSCWTKEDNGWEEQCLIQS